MAAMSSGARPTYFDESPSTTKRATKRLMSVDVFRGATIAAMILVNDAGDEPSSYRWLRHSQWNGWTPTDLVFPFFLFIVGVAMVFSFRSRLQRGESRGALLRHVLWRSALLFAIGLFLNGFPNHYHLTSWRVYGVLQRIAICYLISATLELWTGWKAQLGVLSACLVGYWILMRYVNVPGLGIPGRDVPFLDPDKNLAAWLDRKLLMGHLYEHTRDPEGVLSTIPAIATSLLGGLSGKWLASTRVSLNKVTGMIIAGVCGIALGEFFNQWFPINKKLWTSSYVLLTAGLALIGLAMCYWALDVKRWRRFSVPFLVLGMNSIVAYALSEMLAATLTSVKGQSNDPLTLQEIIYENLFRPFADPPNASLLYALSYVALCWLVMYFLYKKNIFIKI